MCLWGLDLRHRAEEFFNAYWVCFDLQGDDAGRVEAADLGPRQDWRRTPYGRPIVRGCSVLE